MCETPATNLKKIWYFACILGGGAGHNARHSGQRAHQRPRVFGQKREEISMRWRNIFTGILAVACSYSYTSEIDAAGCGQIPCPPSSNPVLCVWGPKKSVCNDATHEHYGPCRCEENRCNSYYASVQSATSGILGGYGPTPLGPCANRPCGKCYVEQTIVCRTYMECRNESGGWECVPGEDDRCRPTPILIITDKFFTPMNTDCCSDVL